MWSTFHTSYSHKIKTQVSYTQNIKGSVVATVVFSVAVWRYLPMLLRNMLHFQGRQRRPNPEDHHQHPCRENLKSRKEASRTALNSPEHRLGPYDGSRGSTGFRGLTSALNTRHKHAQCQNPTRRRCSWERGCQTSSLLPLLGPGRKGPITMPIWQLSCSRCHKQLQ